jgi:hypothetical protein
LRRFVLLLFGGVIGFLVDFWRRLAFLDSLGCVLGGSWWGWLGHHPSTYLSVPPTSSTPKIPFNVPAAI